MSEDTRGRTFGLLIEELRRDKGLSQTALAAAVGISRQAVRGWEHKPFVSPHRAHLRRAARVLGVPVERLYEALDGYERSEDEDRLLSRQVWRVFVDDYLQSDLAKGTKPAIAEQLYRAQGRGFSRKLVHAIRLDLDARASGRAR